jgi:large subunit ribosomal protein L23
VKDARSIVLRPLVTEKSMAGGAEHKYTFEVDVDSNKIEIARAIEEMFPNVNVTKVNTLHVRGKARRVRGPQRGSTAERKKAIVTLKPGQRLEIFEGM